MRTSLPVSIVVILLSSCSKYQYYTLSSDNVPKDQKQQFVFENDTCRVRYDFSGKKGPISITVYNKSIKLLQVDWKRSAVIVGDTATSLFDREVNFSGEIERNRQGINQNINGIISPPEAIEFIPPQASISKQGRFIQSNWLKDLQSEGKDQIVKTKNATQRIKVFNFSKESAPIAFRSYLTLVADDKSFAFDHSFYVTEIVESRAKSVDLVTGDRFYIKGKTDFGKAAGAVGAALFLALLVVAL